MIKKLFVLVFALVTTSSFSKSPITAAANTAPLLTDFRIESNQPDRIYFNSNVEITGSTATGFNLRDHGGLRITGVQINEGQQSGHYFQVSGSFSWTHNNTIEYVGGSNIMSDTSLPLSNFTLQYIKNNIPTPGVKGKEYFVDAAVSGSGNGTSEDKAFKTIQEGVDKLKAGDKLWVKAGHYGSEKVYIKKSGTVSSPIFLEGYKNSPGDITKNYYIYGNTSGAEHGGRALDKTEMPLLDGVNFTSKGINFGEGSSYIYVKNFQIQKYEKGVSVNYYCNNIIIENVIAKDMGKEWTSGAGFKMEADSHDTNYSRLINCVAINGTEEGIALSGNNSLIENTKVYCDQGNEVGNIGLPTDYYIRTSGKNNIIRNSLVNRLSKGHDGHGYSLKYENEYALIEKSEAVNVYWAYQIRHSVCAFNVFRDNVSRGNVSYNSGGSVAGGIHVVSGAHDNTFENMYIHDTYTAFSLERNSEDSQNSSDVGHNNVFKNFVIDNVAHVFLIKNWLSKSASFNNNKFYNFTVNNVTSALFSIRTQYAGVSMSGNEIKNSVFNDVPNLFLSNGNNRALKDSEFSWDSNNFHNSFSGKGSNLLNVSPDFINAAGGDFHLQEGSLLMGAGQVIPEVNTDFDGNPRTTTKGFDIGAYQSQVIVPGISADVTICAGESTEISAFGGLTYLWSNGEVATSQTVSPDETTTYSVEIVGENGTETKSVTVTVIEAPSAEAGDDVETCAGTEVELTATGGQHYEWSTGDLTPTITVKPDKTTTYYVTVSNESCTATAIDSVQVIILAEKTLNAGDDIEICTGSSVTLTATGAENYTWNTGDETDSITVTPTETTTYTVTTIQGDCTFTDEVTITVSEMNTIDAGSDVEMCVGSTVELTVEGEGEFIWSNGETGKRIYVSPTETTIYTVTGTNACNSLEITDEVQVTVFEMPTISAGDDVNLCSGESIVLTASEADNYSWSTGETTQSITVTPTESEIYYVTTTNGTCEARDDVEVTVSFPPSIQLGDDVEICAGSEIELVARGKGKFVWSNGERGRRITVSPTETTTYTVTATGECSSLEVSEEITVTVISKSDSDLSAGADEVICEGSSITLTATGADNYIWSTGETTQSITVNPTRNTTYTVSTEMGSCIFTDEVKVEVKSASVNAGNNVTIERGNSISLTATGEGEFTWSTGETTKSITVNPVEKTTYTVTITTTEGCQNSDKVTVLVTVPTPPIDPGTDDGGTDDNDDDDPDPNDGSSTDDGSGTDDGGGTDDGSGTDDSSNINVGTGGTDDGTDPDTDNTGNEVEEPHGFAGPDQIICNEASTILTASKGSVFLWSTGETTQSITVNPLTTTEFSVTVLDGEDVFSDEVMITIDEDCSGLGNRISTKELKIFPNPTDDIMNIELIGYNERLDISLYNLNGSMVYSESIENYSSEKKLIRRINVKRFAKGIYIVRLANRGTVETKKILVI